MLKKSTKSQYSISEYNEIENNKIYSKLFGCNIHNSIRVSSMAIKIINTWEFQRLRHIKQLGLCHYIYPSATHTRFEHSIGVYHLAGLMIEKILYQYPDKKFLIPEISNEPINLNYKISECIKIAGLCHDIGHGPFSHIFDDILLKNSVHPNRLHEARSCLIVDIICKRELSNELDNAHIAFIKSIINPEKHHLGALYQIVSNKLNGIDVDKFDYLARDTKNLNMCNGFNSYRLTNEFIIDNNDNIAYPKHCSTDVYELFHCRYLMHKKVYNHKTVKLIELMLGDLFVKIDPIFNISKSIEDMNEFCKLTDDTIFYLIQTIMVPKLFYTINLNEDQILQIKEANVIFQNIVSRNLYQLISENTDIKIKDINFKKFLKKILKKYPNLKPEFFAITKKKIGFVNTDQPDPFNNVFFYDKKENNNTFTFKKSHISGLVGNKISETHWYLICKERTIYNLIMEEFKLFE